MLSLGLSGVRTLGNVMLVPDCWSGGWGKGLLVEGDRDRRGLFGVIPKEDSRELGPWAISYVEEEEEEDVEE